MSCACAIYLVWHAALITLPGHMRRPRQYVPKGPEEVVDQALGAIRRAFQDGITRQQVELLLPLIGATDLDDWCAP